MRVLKYFLMIFILLSTFVLHASNCNKLNGKGRFYSKDDDSLDLVKKELLYNAYRDLITKKLECMGLDFKMFWEKFDMAFDKSFQPIKETLKKSYTKVDKEGNEKIEDIEKFEKRLRYKMFYNRRKFGGLDRLISSYKINKMSRSTQYPNSRYINITAKINEKITGNLYYKYTQSKQQRFINKALVSCKVQLDHLSWHDIGVKHGKEFVDALKSSWQKWIKSNWGRFIGDVFITNDYMVSELNKMSSFGSEVLIPLVTSETKGNIDNGITRNSIWVNFFVKIKEIKNNKILKKKELEFSGNYIIKDLMSGQIIAHYDFPKTTKNYFLDELTNLGSIIASYIYRIPTANLAMHTTQISSLLTDERKVMLELHNISSVRDIMDFNNKIMSKGVRLQLRPKLESYNGDSGKILVFFRGEQRELKSFLFGLKNIKIGQGKLISFIAEDNPYVLKLTDLNKVENSSNNTGDKNE